MRSSQPWRSTSERVGVVDEPRDVLAECRDLVGDRVREQHPHPGQRQHQDEEDGPHRSAARETTR